MMNGAKCLWVLVGFCTVIHEGDRQPARAESPRGYVCHRAEEKINVDGRLDEGSWQHAAWTEDFVDIEGDIKERPRFRTRVKMLWDDHYFYFGAKLEEPHVWATLTQHDATIFHDNDFELFIDPDGDNHDYCEVEINAHNTEWDLRLGKPYRDGGLADNSFELPGLKSAVQVEGTLNDPRDIDTGWTVELAIPWESLEKTAHRVCPPSEGDQWRINFSRVEWLTQIIDGKYRKIPEKPEDNWVWSPQGAIDMHRPERWGFVQFSREPFGKQRFRPDPSISVRDKLIGIYYAQREFHKRNGRWAESLDQLDATKASDRRTSPILLQTSPRGFTATLGVTSEQGASKRWNIREDSRIWAE